MVTCETDPTQSGHCITVPMQLAMTVYSDRARSAPDEELPQHCPRQRAVNRNACLSKRSKRLQKSLMEVDMMPQRNADNCHSKVARCAAGI
jgi:hypothetical protein